MIVSNANNKDSQVIASLLSSHFIKINQVFGYNRLKSDEERLLRIISERIEDENSEFKYFVLRDEEKVVGFVNLMLTKEVSEILVLILQDEYKTKENVSLLMQYAIKQFKTLNVSRILTEVNTPDTLFREAILEQDSKIISAFYEINL